MKTKIYLSAILLLIITMFTGCTPDLITVSPIKTFYSEAANDGIVINSSPRQVKDYDTGPQGKRISMGWNASGYARSNFNRELKKTN